MREIRHDPILPRWVLIAEDRASRPDDFQVPAAVRVDRPCVFCPGNEQLTPESLFVVPAGEARPGGPSWRIRVFANRYPAVALEEPPPRGQPGGPGRSAPARGVHEVVVDAAEHVTSLTEMSREQVVDLFDVYRARLAAIRQIHGIAAALVFKNVGFAAGASIEHAHTQILATELVPPEVAAEWEASAQREGEVGECAYCRLLPEERVGERLVAATAGAVAFCPYASRFPYEVCVLPREHSSHLENASRAACNEVAAVVHQVIGCLEVVLDRPAYNFVIHSGPFIEGKATHYHWHVEIYPRITSLAGYELGGGGHINTVAPEKAAKALREAASA